MIHGIVQQSLALRCVGQVLFQPVVAVGQSCFAIKTAMLPCTPVKLMRKDDKKMTIQLAILIISGITLVVIAISTSLLYYQIKSFHEWNRRKETNDFLANIGYGKLAEVRERLRIYVNPW